MTDHDDFFNDIQKRAKDLESESLNYSHAFDRARLEKIFEKWPEKWGDDLQVLIYGGFAPPDQIIHDKTLGITLFPKPYENTVVFGVPCVLKAKVEMERKDVPSLVDAIQRINIFVGAMLLINWGGSEVSWWCHLTHSSSGEAVGEWNGRKIQYVTAMINGLPKDVRRIVCSALYWIRDIQFTISRHFENRLVRTYSSHWNAFESLVGATSILRPKSKLTRVKKQALIDRHIQNCGGKVKLKDIELMYREIVDPGFAEIAKHALRVCFEDNAEEFIYECFERPDKENRLYSIRNAINHGTIDAEYPEEKLRISARFSVLKIMIWQMFTRIIRDHSHLRSA